MNKLLYSTLICLCMLMFSCKTDVKTNDNTSLSVSAKPPQKTEKTSKGEANPSQRSQALSILEHRIKNEDKSYAIVESGIWEYEFVFDGKKMSGVGEQDGRWIDLKPDFNYDYGFYDEVQGKGKYHYTMEEGLLLLIDDDATNTPQEWTVKNAGNAMVLVGTRVYGNNAYQMKLMRKDVKPAK